MCLLRKHKNVKTALQDIFCLPEVLKTRAFPLPLKSLKLRLLQLTNQIFLRKLRFSKILSVFQKAVSESKTRRLCHQTRENLHTVPNKECACPYILTHVHMRCAEQSKMDAHQGLHFAVGHRINNRPMKNAIFAVFIDAIEVEQWRSNCALACRPNSDLTQKKRKIGASDTLETD